MTALMWPAYEVIELRTMREIKEIFPNKTADHLNWLFCSTSGRHGTYKNLDEIELILRGKDPKTRPFDNGKFPATILVVHPRLCIVKYGEIPIGLGDLALLRKLVSTTIEEVIKSQEGNT